MAIVLILTKVGSGLGKPQGLAGRFLGPGTLRQQAPRLRGQRSV